MAPRNTETNSGARERQMQRKPARSALSAAWSFEGTKKTLSECIEHEDQVATPVPQAKKFQDTTTEQALRHCFPFEDISAEASHALWRSFHFVSVPPQMNILNEDEESQTIYFLLKGRVRVFLQRSEACIAFLKEGAIFGEVSALLGLQRTASVMAEEWCLVGVLTREEFSSALEQYPEDRQRVLSKAEQRYKERQRHNRAFLDLLPDADRREQQTFLVAAPGWTRPEHIILPGKLKTAVDLSMHPRMSRQQFNDLVANTEKLSRLKAKGCFYLDDGCLSELCSRQNSLRQLDLSYNPQLSADVFLALQPVQNTLQRLDLSRCNGIASPGLEKVLSSLSFPAMDTLVFSGCVFVSSAGLSAILLACSSLASLDLSFSAELTDSVMQSILQNRRLRRLDVSFCSLAEDSLRQLSQATALEKLSVRGNRRVDTELLEKMLEAKGSLKKIDARNIDILDKTRILALSRQAGVEVLLFS